MANSKKVISPAYSRFSKSLRGEHPTLVDGSLFGMPCLKVDKKAFVGSYDGGLVVRLLTEDAEVALEIDGAKGFDPSERGKPMKGWVVLPVSARRRWKKLALKAMEYAEQG